MLLEFCLFSSVWHFFLLRSGSLFPFIPSFNYQPTKQKFLHYQNPLHIHCSLEIYAHPLKRPFRYDRYLIILYIYPFIYILKDWKSRQTFNKRNPLISTSCIFYDGSIRVEITSSPIHGYLQFMLE